MWVLTHQWFLMFLPPEPPTRFYIDFKSSSHPSSRIVSNCLKITEKGTDNVDAEMNNISSPQLLGYSPP